MLADIDNAIADHDKAVSQTGLDIWIGAEPTFTLPTSEESQWLSQALGGNKKSLALKITQKLYQRHPGSVILRTVGRQYSGEDLPRWSFGLYERRDNLPVWHGPPDPIAINAQSAESGNLEAFVAALELAFEEQRWQHKCLACINKAKEIRLLVCLDDDRMKYIDATDPRLARCLVHEEKTAETGLIDRLAEEGYYLFIIKHAETSEDGKTISIELPAFKQVADFQQCLSLVGMAANEAGLKQLQINGYPPPVDDSVAWTTVTPDPAVIEINQAPQPDIADFYAANRELFKIAGTLGLSSYRLQYNGNVTDSGGGGQFTLGGKTATESPFFQQPQLLPRLIRYFCLHPSLSYLFATDYVGSASQSPRVDENTRDAFRELQIALEQLQQQPDASPEFLWSSLAPFLADASGNSHRSELNIEKLWNPHLPLRGCLGLLEFRAFRMPFSAERSVAIAMLLRAITAMLSANNLAPQLQDWGDTLHDRFALPMFLQQDLQNVFKDLEKTGFGLASCIQSELLKNSDRSNWSVDFVGCQISIEQAIEFWPLVGDVASQESGGSRLVDSSTLRLQVMLRQPKDTDSALHDWQLQLNGYSIPLHAVTDDSGEISITGLRYRDFIPWHGLHPSIEVASPITLYLSHPEQENALEITLHNWKADKSPYNGLPDSPDKARHRRLERLVVNTIPFEEKPPAVAAPESAANEFTFDLRRL